jgi:hypothetical protein
MLFDLALMAAKIGSDFYLLRGKGLCVGKERGCLVLIQLVCGYGSDPTGQVWDHFAGPFILLDECGMWLGLLAEIIGNDKGADGTGIPAFLMEPSAPVADQAGL